MKIFKKFNPNEDYLLRIQLSLAVVLIAINFAFTRTVERIVNQVTIEISEPIAEQGVITIIPPPRHKKKITTASSGTKIVAKELEVSLIDENVEPDDDFKFDPEGTFRFNGNSKQEDKKKKIVFTIPDAPFAIFPGGNANIPKYLQLRIEYPEEALLLGASCSMEVELTVDENGWVKEVHFISENEDAYFFKESIKEVLLAMPKFVPAASNNRYIETRILVPIQFILN